MPIADFASHDVVDLARMVKRGEASALELVEAAIAVIERHNPRLNAVVQIGFEMARAAAKALDPSGPLAGVPFLAKDTNVDVAGFRTSHGSRYFADSPVREDDELPRRWRQAGLIILGKTNTPELAGDFVTEPTLWGPTHNPWALDRTPGGSSGGAAAAVASGMVPLAHGTDSGGSIRAPAA
ncbi:MAG: amidase family protein, partial [Dongiaceae bacterium]